MKLLSGNSCWSISDTEVLAKPSPQSGLLSLTPGFLSPESADGATWIKDPTLQTDPEFLRPALPEEFCRVAVGSRGGRHVGGSLVFPGQQNLKRAWHRIGNTNTSQIWQLDLCPRLQICEHNKRYSKPLFYSRFYAVVLYNETRYVEILWASQSLGRKQVVGWDSWAPGEGLQLPGTQVSAGWEAWVCGGQTGARGAEGRLTKGDGPIEAHRVRQAMSHVRQWRGSAWAILSESFSKPFLCASHLRVLCKHAL